MVPGERDPSGAGADVPGEPAASGPRHASPLKNPWWIPPFFGGVPPVEPRLIRLLGLVTLGVFFEQYDLSLISAAIKHINDDLGIGIGESGYYLSAIRLGGFLTFAIVPFADRIGRRRIFLVSLIGMSVFTLLSGLSQTALQFTIAQVLTRAFLLASIAVAVVILTEEFPAAHRGWAIGVMGAVGGFGFGLGAALFSLIDWLPYGWRAMYVVGITPVLLLPMFRRELSETSRFRAHAERRGDAELSLTGFGPVLALARSQPRRALILGFAAGVGALGTIAAFQYASLYVQTVHGWEPWRYSLMIVVGGGIGMFGNVVSGRLGDRFGRRRVGLTAYLLLPVAIALMYRGPADLVWVGFAGLVFFNSAGEVVTRAMAGELFSTGQRAAATGWLTFMLTLGWTLGLFAIGLATEETGDLVATITALGAIVAVAGLCLFFLPETRSRELEEIAPEA